MFFFSNNNNNPIYILSQTRVSMNCVHNKAAQRKPQASGASSNQYNAENKPEKLQIPNFYTFG